MGISDYKLSLVANTPQTINVSGDAFHVLLAGSPVYLSFDDGTTIKRYQGVGGTAPKAYTKVSIESEVNQNVTLSLGSGTIFDSRSNISATLNTTIAPANINTPLTSVVISPGATVLLVGADADRKELRIGIKSDNVDGIYFGDINTAVGVQGGWIELGGVEYITSEAPIYGYNPHPTDSVTVNLVSLRRV